MRGGVEIANLTCMTVGGSGERDDEYGAGVARMEENGKPELLVG